jgi:hypothetical protein
MAVVLYPRQLFCVCQRCGSTLSIPVSAEQQAKHPVGMVLGDDCWPCMDRDRLNARQMVVVGHYSRSVNLGAH